MISCNGAGVSRTGVDERKGFRSRCQFMIHGTIRLYQHHVGVCLVMGKGNESELLQLKSDPEHDTIHWPIENTTAQPSPVLSLRKPVLSASSFM